VGSRELKKATRL